MPSLLQNDGNIGVRDNRRAHALRAVCAGALATTGAFTCLTVVRPDLASLGALEIGPTALVVGIGCVAAAGLAAAAARAKPAGRKMSSPSAERSSPPKPSENVSSGDPGDSRVQASVSELAEAVASARISRVLLINPNRGKAPAAVALARRLVERGDPTILVDFDGGATAGELGLLEPIESIENIAASPTTFAHSIQRDRSSRAHVMAAHLGLAETDVDRSAASMASVLATLEEVYSRTVVVLPSAMTTGALVDKNTAVVAPSASAMDAMLRATIEHLSAQGIADLILIAEDTRGRSAGDSIRTASSRPARR